jgi:alpha-beta hydrolase superfamily lysophospholipase
MESGQNEIRVEENYLKRMLLKIFIFVLTSVVIYFGIAFVLIIIGKHKNPHGAQRGPTFNELRFDYSCLPTLQPFSARDGTTLSYRHYPAPSTKILILLHGSGWHSQYFLPLAKFITSEALAQVYTPDLRGHGRGPVRRGDVAYIDQLEDDLADLISKIRKDHPKALVIVGGHSSGGGLAVRFAGSRYGKQANAYVLFSPFLKYNAPTTRSRSGGWAYPYTARIVGLTMLNNAGIHWFDYLPAIEFNMPEEVRNGTETLSYSHRLNVAYAPRNYKNDLRTIRQPLLVVAGTGDESFFAEQYEPIISRYTAVNVKLLQGVTHMGVVVGPEVRPVVKDWLEGLLRGG